MYALGEGPTQGWTSPLVLAGAVVGPILLVVLIVSQLRQVEGLLQLRLYGDRGFATTSAAVFVGNATFFGLLYLIALYLQGPLGLSAQDAGLVMLAEAVTVAVGAQVSSRVAYRRLGPRRSIVGGLLGVATAAGAMAVRTGGPLWGFVLCLVLLGGAWSQVFIPATASAFDHIADRDTARASTLFTTMRQFGSALGVAVLAAVASRGLVAPSDYEVPFLAAALLGVVGAGVAAAVPASPSVTRGGPTAPHGDTTSP